MDEKHETLPETGIHIFDDNHKLNNILVELLSKGFKYPDLDLLQNATTPIAAKLLILEDPTGQNKVIFTVPDKGPHDGKFVAQYTIGVKPIFTDNS